ncbi:porin [Paraburkholderia strydomiana]|jgi:predicted porin|uniref:Porin n=1 Tax=Paraburkholderia strydomiana TaxID=1245417 RepID=A0ABW9ENS7_9BURK
MNKALIALSAASLASTAAMAQSSVTLYGIVDAGVQWTNHNLTSSGGGASTFAAESGGASTSRWGIIAREDLGGGLAAVVNLENGFDATKGTVNNGGRLFGRSAFVGLKSSTYGQLTFGRMKTAVYEFGVLYDAVGPATWSASVLDSAIVGRADNSVNYEGSFAIGGGKLGIKNLYSFGYDSVAGAGPVAGDYKIGKEESLMLTYDYGAANIGLLYDAQNGNTVAARNTRISRYGVGVSYDFKPFQLIAAYRLYTQRAAVNTSEALYWLATRYQATPFLNINAAVYYVDDRNTGHGQPIMVSILGSYLLSKQTDIYLNVAMVANKANSSLGLAGYNTVTEGALQTGAMIGVRHRF